MKSIPILIFTALLILCSCREVQIMEEDVEACGEECTLELSFSTGDGVSKSGIFQDELPRDLNLYVWRNGKCVQHSYSDVVEGKVTIALVNGSGYNFYALVNCGEALLPPGEKWMTDEDSMKELAVPFPDSEGSSFPMCGSIKSVDLRNSSNSLVFLLERLVSRIRLNFSPDVALGASDIQITSVRTVDAAASMKPFTPSNKSESGNLICGDYASAEDLERLNSGGEVDFYVFENCWGELLPDNTDQKLKVPDSFGQLRGPTYLEIGCSFGQDKLLTGQLTYRIFPGSNATTNFDLVRNSSCTISLYGSKNGLDELSWRIESDLGFNDHLSSFKVVNGHHYQQLYMGEIFQGKIYDIDPSVTAYFGGDLQSMASNIKIRCLKDGSGDVIDFTILGTDEEGILVEGTCTDLAQQGILWICDKDGNCITRLPQPIAISCPEIVFSTNQRSPKPVPLSSDPVLTINGNSTVCYLYLCDHLGRNLMSASSGCYDFNPQVFNFSLTNNSATWQCEGQNISNRMTAAYLAGFDGAAFGKIEVKLENAGTYANGNKYFWEMCHSETPIYVDFNESRIGTVGRLDFNMTYIPLKVHFCDSSFGGKAKGEEFGVSSRLFIYVENKSKIAFNLTQLTLAEAGDVYMYNKTYPAPSNMKYYFYNCPSEWNIPKCLYMIMAEIKVPAVNKISSTGCSSRVSGSDFIMELNGNFENLLDAIRCAESKYFLNNFGYTGRVPDYYMSELSDGLRHMVDVWNDFGGEVNYEYYIELENGSASSNVVYGDYPLKWFSFYSNGVLLASKDSSYNMSNLYGSFPDLKPLNISRMMDKSVDISFDIIHSQESDAAYQMSFSRTIVGTNFPYDLFCEGKCDYHPKGQWGKMQTSYPITSVSNSNSGYGTHSRSENLTERGIQNCFQNIFNITYKDYYSNLQIESKSWQHHSHPTKLILYPYLSLSADNEKRALWNMTFTSAKVIYNNPSYDAKYDNNPYTVPATIDFSDMHKNFTHQMIVIR